MNTWNQPALASTDNVSGTLRALRGYGLSLPEVLGEDLKVLGQTSQVSYASIGSRFGNVWIDLKT